MKYDLYAKHGVKYLKKEKYMFVKQIDKRMNASAIKDIKLNSIKIVFGLVQFGAISNITSS